MDHILIFKKIQHHSGLKQGFFSSLYNPETRLLHDIRIKIYFSMTCELNCFMFLFTFWLKDGEITLVTHPVVLLNSVWAKIYALEF